MHINETQWRVIHLAVFLLKLAMHLMTVLLAALFVGALILFAIKGRLNELHIGDLYGGSFMLALWLSGWCAHQTLSHWQPRPMRIMQAMNVGLMLSLLLPLVPEVQPFFKTHLGSLPGSQNQLNVDHLMFTLMAWGILKLTALFLTLREQNPGDPRWQHTPLLTHLGIPGASTWSHTRQVAVELGVPVLVCAVTFTFSLYARV